MPVPISDSSQTTTTMHNNKISRHQTRFVAIQAITQAIYTNFTSSLQDFLATSNITNIDFDFFDKLYKLVSKHGQLLTQILQKTMISRDFNTLSAPLRAIFYTSLAEMLYLRTPVPVLINEYVILTKRLCEPWEYKMVHGVLNALAKDKPAS